MHEMTIIAIKTFVIFMLKYPKSVKD